MRSPSRAAAELLRQRRLSSAREWPHPTLRHPLGRPCGSFTWGLAPSICSCRHGPTVARRLACGALGGVWGVYGAGLLGGGCCAGGGSRSVPLAGRVMRCR